MNVEKDALWDIVNTEVKRQAADHFNDSIATDVEEIFMDTIQLATDSLASQKKSTFNGIINV